MLKVHNQNIWQMRKSVDDEIFKLKKIKFLKPILNRACFKISHFLEFHINSITYLWSFFIGNYSDFQVPFSRENFIPKA
jgi:hypothetical protein